jgi:UDPglucose 6-dehydrogenase
MKISVFGTGYVGLATGVCFADMGYTVVCLDIDPAKVEKLNKGIPTIFEPGLEDLLKRNLAAARLSFTTDYKKAVDSSDILFIAVGTPSDENGSANLSYVVSAAESIGQYMTSKKTIMTKSTVPVGTNFLIKKTITETLNKRAAQVEFDIVSNPEFLREGTAIHDCLNPDRIVVGVEHEAAAKVVQRLYEPFIKNGAKMIEMDVSSAEVTKYAANAFLATKISIMNEFSRLCDKVGANIENVRIGLSADHRIGPHFIYAGVGYGGSCFPKDVKALIHTGRIHDEQLHILEAVEKTNQFQRQRFVDQVLNRIGSSGKGKKIAVWGVAFKPGTDDIRESPSLYAIERFVEAGFAVEAYDPIAAENARVYLKSSQVEFKATQDEVLENADVLCIFTEWKSFLQPDFPKLKKLMKNSLIFDGRNIYDPDYIKETGFEYHSIGRPSIGAH